MVIIRRWSLAEVMMKKLLKKDFSSGTTGINEIWIEQEKTII
jgi:hypothetical protein